MKYIHHPLKSLTASSVELLPERRDRILLLIENRSTTTEAYIRIDGDPTATTSHLWIPKSTRVTFGPPPNAEREAPTGGIDIIGSGVEASVIFILEGVAGDMV